jgi:zinc D-Ala-D-Ala carboxypeptidase
MQLSPHFALHEFLSSQTAARMGRPIVPSLQIIENLTRLCVTLLEPIRVKLQRSIVITSGYRPDWLNVAIGGSKTSNHMMGFAADIKVVGMSPLIFSRWVQHNADAEGWPIDQCILEFPPNGWTHLGIAEKPRQQYLTARSVDGRTAYVNGLLA